MYRKCTLTSYLGAALMYMKYTLTSYFGAALMYRKCTLTSYLGAALKTSLWRGVGHETTSHLGCVPREERGRIKSLGAMSDCPVNVGLSDGWDKAWIFCPS